MSNLITIDSTKLQVHSVCVFQSNRAEVRRVVEVQLKAGQNEVCVEKLPNCLDGDSIRVEGLGNAVIFDVIHSGAPVTPYGAKGSKHEEIRALEKQVAALEAERAILQDQARVLEDYSKTLTAEKADIAKLTDFLGVYKEKRATIHKGLEETRDLLEKVQEQLDAKKKEQNEDEAGKKRGVKVTVIVLADVDGKAELSLWYVVWGASWSPLYDLRATISKTPKEPSKISLQYRASISQSTGEDWDDVDLTLSTASPQHGTEIPTLDTQRIGPVYTRTKSAFGGSVRKRASVIQQSQQVMMYASAPMPPPSGAVADTMMLETSKSVEPVLFAHATASAVEGATSSTFAIAGRSTIPSDSQDGEQTHKVSIAVIDLDAKLEWIAVPKLQATAFLRCQVKNTSQYILLPGPSSVFMDNNFVCKSTLPNVSPQESFSTSLGVDPSIKVTYHNLQKKAKNSSGGLLASKVDITSFTQRITVKNNRSTAVSPLFIKDQVPISEDADIKVSLLEPKELGVPKERKEVAVAAGAKARWAFHEGDEGKVEEEGVVEWVCEVESSKSLDLTVAWDVSAPTGQQWVKY